MGSKLYEDFHEIANILQYVIEYDEKDPIKRSAFLDLIQKRVTKALDKLEPQLVKN